MPDGLRLPTANVTVLVGPEPIRRRVVALVLGGSARCASGHDTGIEHIAPDASSSAPERVAALEGAARRRLRVAVVDRLTAGLDAQGRRCVLAALRPLAATGTAVLVDDDDPVAALSVADTALRIDADGGIVSDDLRPAALWAS
jgi:hypothetical protein